MSVGDIQTAPNTGNTYNAFNFDRYSRTLLAAMQMAGDGVILSTLSYLSLSFVVYLNGPARHIEYLGYVILTTVLTITMIVGFARSGVYDIFDEFKRAGILRTLKCLALGILLLVACLFILKVSDNVS